jgi:hypothetical protein
MSRGELPVDRNICIGIKTDIWQQTAVIWTPDEVIPMEKLFIYFRRITRPDTLNSENSMGRVWYDKSNNHVEFFTSFGRHPENGKPKRCHRTHP